MSRTQAIRIACEGEKGIYFKTKEYSTYEILEDHDIFIQGEVSQLSALVGVPLLVLKVRPSVTHPKWHDYNKAAMRAGKRPVTYGYIEDGRFSPNPVAASLMVQCSRTQHDATPLLATPEKWLGSVGSVLIVRQDKMPLHNLHISMLLAFFTTALQQDEVSNEVSIKERATPSAFQAFYTSALEFLVAADVKQDWSNVPLPFVRGLTKDAPLAEEGSLI